MKIFNFACLLALTVFSSCEKENEIVKDNPMAQEVNPDADFDLVYNPETGLSEMYEKGRRPEDCCRCELQITANAESGINPFDDNSWEVRLEDLNHENCYPISIIQVGNNSTSFYDTPGQLKSFEFFVRRGEASQANLEAKVNQPDSYNGPLPLNIYANVRCEVLLSSNDDEEPLGLNLSCSVTGSGSNIPAGCNGTNLTQDGHISSECYAFKKRPRE